MSEVKESKEDAMVSLALKNEAEAQALLASDINKWTNKVNDPTIKVYSMSHPSVSGATLWRVESEIGCPTNVFMDMFLHSETNPLWRHSIVSIKCIEAVQTGVDVLLMHLRSVPMISDRDVCDIRRWVLGDAPGSFSVTWKAYTHDKCPPQSNPVRAENIAGAINFSVHPSDPSKTALSWVFCCDLKGWIPSMVVQSSSAKCKLPDCVVHHCYMFVLLTFCLVGLLYSIAVMVLKCALEHFPLLCLCRGLHPPVLLADGGCYTFQPAHITNDFLSFITYSFLFRSCSREGHHRRVQCRRRQGPVRLD